MLEQISPSVWRLVLPSRTLPPFQTTNSYLVANAHVGVIIEAPSAAPEALQQLKTALDKAQVKTLKGLLLTHTHPDHCEGAQTWQQAFDLQIWVHPHELTRLQTHGVTNPTALQGERTLIVGNTHLTTHFTPGHSPGHLAFRIPEERVMLAGDIAVSIGSTWVGVPEGNVTAYLESLAQVMAFNDEVLGCGHGEIIQGSDAVRARLQALYDHRLAREAQVVSVLAQGPLTLGALRERIYPDLADKRLQSLADKSLLAHLYRLMQMLRVMHVGQDEQGPYALQSVSKAHKE